MHTLKGIQDEIAQAFKNAKIPRTESELSIGGIDGPYVIKHFLGRDQHDIEHSDFPSSLYMEDFSYMTTRAIEYYLPCVLRIMLRDPYDYDLWLYLYSFLHANRKGKLNWNLQELDTKQMIAISIWAEYLYELWQVKQPEYINPEEALNITKSYKNG